jgi:hypothetical protein
MKMLYRHYASTSFYKAGWRNAGEVETECEPFRLSCPLTGLVYKFEAEEWRLL